METLNLTTDFKKQVLAALLNARKNFTGTDGQFARSYQMHSSVFSQLKAGKIGKLLTDPKWLIIGQRLNVTVNDRQWKVARTAVFETIEKQVVFCQKYSKGRVLVDDCGIGKTFAAKYLSRTLKNCFYVDASQAKSRQQFVRLLARTLGVEDQGRYVDVKNGVKYYLRILTKPVVIIDEAGDLDYPAFLDIKELWNATEGICGWYMMGADGLRAKIDKGIISQRVGFREIFSRFSDAYGSVVPVERSEKIEFYKKLITDVLIANAPDKSVIPAIVKKCLVQNSGNIGGLRRAESLLILNS